jgi:uncharacterized protein
VKAIVIKFLASILYIAPIISFGASFDCSKAVTSIEKTICSNQELSALDDKLGVTYKNVKETYSPEFFKNIVSKNQQTWLKNIKSNCIKDVDKCLAEEYKKRIETLSSATRKEKGYLVFSGKIDSADPFFKKINERGSVVILSENLFYVDNESIMSDSAPPKCYRSNSFFRKSDNKELSNNDLFVMTSVKKFAIELANNFLTNKENKDRLIREKITKEDLIEDIEDKIANELNEFTISKDTFTINHVLSRSSECADVYMSTETSRVRNYLTPFLIKELGL